MWNWLSNYEKRHQAFNDFSFECPCHFQLILAGNVEISAGYQMGPTQGAVVRRLCRKIKNASIGQHEFYGQCRKAVKIPDIEVNILKQAGLLRRLDIGDNAPAEIGPVRVIEKRHGVKLWVEKMKRGVFPGEEFAGLGLVINGCVYLDTAQIAGYDAFKNDVFPFTGGQLNL